MPGHDNNENMTLMINGYPGKCRATSPLTTNLLALVEKDDKQFLEGVVSNVHKGGLSHFPPKFKNIFVVVITFSPFLLCKNNYYTSLLLIVCALR